MELTVRQLEKIVEIMRMRNHWKFKQIGNEFFTMEDNGKYWEKITI